jgi:hypothetical protein
MTTNTEGEGQGDGAVFCCKTLPDHVIVIAVVNVPLLPSSPVCLNVLWGATLWPIVVNLTAEARVTRGAMAVVRALALVMMADTAGAIVMAMAAVRLVSMVAAGVLATQQQSQ